MKTLDQHIGVRIPGGQPSSFSHFRVFLFFLLLLLVRSWCVLVGRGFRVSTVHPGDVSGNQVPVGVNRGLNGAVAHLLLHVDERSTVLNQQRAEGVGADRGDGISASPPSRVRAATMMQKGPFRDGINPPMLGRWYPSHGTRMGYDATLSIILRGVWRTAVNALVRRGEKAGASLCSLSADLSISP